MYYKRYVDDIFVLLEKAEQIHDLLIVWTKDTKILNFPLKPKNITSFFFDVKIFREKDQFTTSVLRKDTHSDVNTNVRSFIALEHKFGVVYTLSHRNFTAVFDFSKFRFKVETLKKALHKNAYPIIFVDKFIPKFVSNIFAQIYLVLLPPFQNGDLE